MSNIHSTRRTVSGDFSHAGHRIVFDGLPVYLGGTKALFGKIWRNGAGAEPAVFVAGVSLKCSDGGKVSPADCAAAIERNRDLLPF